MKLKVKYSLGIDISGTSISLAHLKQDSHGIHLLHAARRPMPEGLMEGGLIENPKLLKHIIRDLRRKCKQTKLTTLSLFSSRALTQIMEVPSAVALNLGQHIQKEIRQYVNLAGVKTVTDYRSLESTGESKRVFVAAGDLKTVTIAANSCEDVGLNVQVI
jgi:Tfp pilus assembly PilM family ATPase